MLGDPYWFDWSIVIIRGEIIKPWFQTNYGRGLSNVAYVLTNICDEMSVLGSQGVPSQSQIHRSAIDLRDSQIHLLPCKLGSG